MRLCQRTFPNVSLRWRNSGILKRWFIWRGGGAVGSEQTKADDQLKLWDQELFFPENEYLSLLQGVGEIPVVGETSRPQPNIPRRFVCFATVSRVF